MRGVRRTGGGRGLRWGPGKIVDGAYPGQPQSFWHQRRPVDDCNPGRREMVQGGGTRGGTFHGRCASFNRFSICMLPDSHTQLPNSCLRPFVSFFCVSLEMIEMSLFPSIMYRCRFVLLIVRRVRRTFSPSGCFSTFRPRAGYLTSAYVILE